jgi:translocation and assembly module TamB
MRKRKIAWIGIAMVASLATLGYLTFRSPAFHRYVLTQIQRRASQATGAQVRIESIAFHLPTLAVDAYGITIRAGEPPDARPLLQAEQLKVRLTIVSLLRRKVDLNEIVLRRPVANLLVARDGTTNLPTPPKSNDNTSRSPFDLGIQHLLVEEGEIYYNDVKTPIDAEFCDVRLEMKSAFEKGYDGSLSYRDGRVRYRELKAVPHRLIASFNANPSKFSLKPLILTVASSTIELEAEVQNYAQPMVNGSYKITVHSRDVAPVLKSAERSSGEATLAGSLHYRHQANVPAIRGVVIDGRLSGHELSLNLSDLRAVIRNVRGEFELVDGNLDIHALEADLLGGHLATTATIQHLNGKSMAKLHASAQGISLVAAKASLRSLNLDRVPVDGRIDGTADATWTGGGKNIHARTDIALTGALTDAAAASKEVPLDGAVHLSYEGNSRLTTLTNTFVRTPATRVEITGTAGPRFDLKVLMHAEDLREVRDLADAFGNAAAFAPANAASTGAANVAGGADLLLLVEGSSNDPRIHGRLTGRSLQVNNTEWRSLELTLRVDRSAVSIENGSLIGARQGHIHFAFRSGLSNWRYLPSSPVAVQVASQDLAIDQLLRLGKFDYPVSGNLAVNLSMKGSQLEPEGRGSVRLTHAKFYGQPLQELAAEFKGNGDALTCDIHVNAAEGHGKGNFAFYPKSKGYELEMDAPDVKLEELQSLRDRNLGIRGTLNATARGRGSLDDPQLTVAIQIPQLQIRETNISDVKANVNVANHEAQVTLGSEVAQSLVQAQGTVNLAGTHYVRGTLDTKGIPIEGLLALYKPAKPNGPRGIVEVHASAEGPLNDNTRLQAHVTIPTLKAEYQGLQIGNTRPIQVHYANSVVALDPMEIAGAGTNFRLQGQLPLQGSSPATLSATGAIDLQLLRFFDPDLQSSGKLLLDVRGTGTTDRPNVEGQLRLENVSVTPSDAPMGLQNVNGLLAVGNNQVTITQLAGQVGGGEISARGYVAYRPQLEANVTLQGKNIRIRYQDAIRAMLGGELSLVGTSQAASLRGRVLIDSLRFTQNFDLANVAGQVESGPQSAPSQGIAERVKLDVSVQTSRDLNLTSSAMSLQGQANLRIIGTAADPVVVGRTEFTAGDIFMMNKRYQIERGLIEFSNPHRTEPVLNLRLTSTINQYNLNLTLRGPLDKLQTSYVSDPPLPTADIINLMARGQTAQQAAASPSSLGASSLLAQGAASQVSGGVQKLAGLSSLSIDPTLGGNNSDPGARIAMQKRVTKNFLFTFATDVTSTQRELIQGEYQFNKHWSASVTRDENGGFAVDGKYHKRY